MRKIVFYLLCLLPLNSLAQKISSSKWTDLFSYNNVIAIREDGGKLIAATENGLFFYTPKSGEISKLSKANGLHEVKITAFDYNAETKTGLVGYKNGSLDVITPEGITYIVDIPIATGYNGDKRINHISITGNLAVISAGYGVSIFNLDRREFADTSFFINNGIYQASNEAVIRDNTVYAATSTGLKSHELNVTFPIYTTWTVIANGPINQVSNGTVLTYANSNQVFFGSGTSFASLPQNFNAVQDVLVTDENIIVTDLSRVYIYTLGGSSIKSIEVSEDLNTAYFDQTDIYAGTKTAGIVTEAGENIKPDGPFSNTSYKITLLDQQIAVSSGGRDGYNAPIDRNLGYYHFDGSKWIYPDLFLQNSSVRFNVMDAVINPSKPEEIFFTNYTYIDGQKGIYRMLNDEFVKRYQSTGGVYNRVIGAAFDEKNQLFVSVWGGSGTTMNGFYVYDAGSDSFKLKDVVSGKSVQKPFASGGILYIPSPFTGGGMILYKYNGTALNFSDDRFKVINKTNNLPADQVISAALDKNDELWIGTETGLRILSNPGTALEEDNPQTSAIIIEENGVGEELFRDSQILQIEVDSGNQKWVSIEGGGVFYLSSNGEKTLSQFNRSNSPLPTNSITDIKVDSKTGKVYFVTLDGIVVYQGDVLEVTENFGDVLVYPNPVVYAQYKGNVRIRGLAAKTNIRITDAAGNLVHQAVSRGGSYEWNLANHRGVRVASGIYFVLMTNTDGTDTATAKIGVVN